MNTDLLILILVVASLLAAGAAWPLLRRRRRHVLMRQPFPPEWVDILNANLPVYRAMPSRLKATLHGLTHVLLAEKNFEGCGGLTLTHEMRLTIAAQAAMLLLNGRGRFFPRCQSILVYPDAYTAPSHVPAAGGFVIEEEEDRLGESWRSGAVVVSWDSLLAESRDRRWGSLVLHEFAHQLDQECGEAEGIPALEPEQARRWQEVFGREYRRLVRKVEQDRDDAVLDEYGATDPAEFFAVATETFFTQPQQLKRVHDELYRELARFYRVDPAAWDWQK
ncbi:MAG: M90 family metallopeptidase [Planctomycetaceae bacterium]|nr:zinc-dependent peptidase [Planctomycetaceae bacterium]